MKTHIHQPSNTAYIFCPGCKHAHSLPLSPWKGSDGKEHPGWTFNGNLESPSFQPSLVSYYINPETKQQINLCHFILTDGVMNFQGDCQHDLKSQQVPLPDFPENYGLPGLTGKPS